MPVAKKRVEFENERGMTLVGVLHRAGAGGPLVVLCHGMLSNMASPKHLETAERLQARGISCLRFDFCGRGESQGRLEDLTVAGEIQDLDAAVRLARALGFGPIGLYGSSLGGHVALSYACGHGDIAAVAVVNAPARLSDLLERMDTGTWLEKGFLETDEGRLGACFYRDALDRDLLATECEPGAEMLIVQSEQDEVVPPEHGWMLATRFAAPLVILEGADHRLSGPGDREGMMEEVVEFLEGALAATG